VSDAVSSTTLPRIAIAGLGIESSTFSPARTDAAAFHPLRGAEILARYSEFLGDGMPLRAAADWHPTLVGKALPGGLVTAAAFAALSDEIIERLAALPQLDGLWFDIHGAMTVEGIDDAEAVLLQGIRETVGDDVLITTTMDLHGNVSRELAHRSDLITCYRMAPHEDHLVTKERGVRNLVERLAAGAGRPLKAWVPVPVLLPGEKTSTRIEPAKGLYAQVPEITARPGVLDAAIWVGYAWADEPRNRAAVVVTGDDEQEVRAGAERLAHAFWRNRRNFEFVAPAGTFEDCVVETPDLTDVSRTVIYASLPAPQAVAVAEAAGVGASVTVAGGAAVDDRHAGPVTVTGVVHAIRHGDRDAETEVVLRVGGLHVILTRLRKPYHLESDFTQLGLDPRNADIVFVKIGYLEPELYDMAAGWRLALTPGGVDQDLMRLRHRRIRRPMFPFDDADFEPDLSARLIPASNVPLSGEDN
jgi:microcystin degradation protein MlrC